MAIKSARPSDNTGLRTFLVATYRTSRGCSCNPGTPALIKRRSSLHEPALPPRESAQRELLESHLSEGNWNEVRRSYETYRELLYREFGTEPTPELQGLLTFTTSPSQIAASQY